LSNDSVAPAKTDKVIPAKTTTLDNDRTHRGENRSSPRTR
jgi:hypothetical protein